MEENKIEMCSMKGEATTIITFHYDSFITKIPASILLVIVIVVSTITEIAYNIWENYQLQ